MGHNCRKDSWRAALVPALASAIVIALIVAPIIFFLLKSSGMKSSAVCTVLPCESAMAHDISHGEVAATISNIKPIATGSISNNLGWTEFSEAYIFDFIDRLQHPDDCREANLMIVEADESGKVGW